MLGVYCLQAKQYITQTFTTVLSHYKHIVRIWNVGAKQACVEIQLFRDVTPRRLISTEVSVKRTDSIFMVKQSMKSYGSRRFRNASTCDTYPPPLPNALT
jgi:hypothetical protein